MRFAAGAILLAWSLFSGPAVAQYVSTTGAGGGSVAQTQIAIFPIGADPTGTADSTTALGTWMDAVRTYIAANAGNPAGGILGAGVVAKLPYGRYVFSSTLNWTGLAVYPTRIPVTIDGQGSTLDCRVNGDACIDALNNSGIEFKNFMLSVSCLNSPRSTVGFQYGRISSNAADSNHLSNITITGCATVANLYTMMSESGLNEQLRLINADPTATNYTLILDGINHFGLTSHYQTITLTADAPIPMNNWLCVQCSMMSTHASGGKAIWMANQYHPRFISSYALTQSSKTPVDLYTGIGAIWGADFDLHMENTTIPANFFITGGGTVFTVTAATWAAGIATFTTSVPHNIGLGGSVKVAGMNPSGYNGTYTAAAGTSASTIKVAVASDPGAFVAGGTATEGNDPFFFGFRWLDQTVFSTTSMFSADANITSVTIQGADLTVGTVWTAADKLFDTPALYSLTGTVSLSSATPWNAPASFVGMLHTGATGQFLTNAGINTQNASYTVVYGDQNKTVSGTVSSADIAYTLPQAGATSGFVAGWKACFRNAIAQSTTMASANVRWAINIKATTSTIDGVAGATGIWLDAQQSTCVTSDGTNYFSEGIKGPKTQIQTLVGTTSDVTAVWYAPHNMVSVQVDACGGGGGGGAGVASAVDGSGGGGGGGCRTDAVAGSVLAASEQVKAGGSGAGGVVGGAAATAGGTTCFGGSSTACTAPIMLAGGGGPGLVAGATAGGGGGPGGTCSTEAFAKGSIGTTTTGAGGCGSSTTIATYSAGPGATGTTTVGGAGFSSGNSAAGGGAGGNGNNAGGSGGVSALCGGVTGGAGSVTTASDGTAGASGTTQYLATFNPGCGGGGGGGTTTGTAGLGGAGSSYGGGGGGGGAASGAGTAKAGGAGGIGMVRVTTQF